MGRIRVGQPVRYTVDAYPRAFSGKVEQVRLNAMMLQNVVVYTVVVATDNPTGKLLPYMTASAHFEVAHDKAVLLVPNAALLAASAGTDRRGRAGNGLACAANTTRGRSTTSLGAGR